MHQNQNARFSTGCYPQISAAGGDTHSHTLPIAGHAFDPPYRARQLYKNISMLFLFPVTRDLLFTNI